MRGTRPDIDVAAALRPASAHPGRCAHIVMLLLLAGCDARLDVSQPISLDPEGAWTDVQRTSLENAAESWNVELGTHLGVQGAADQRVPLRLSEFVCAFTNGVTSQTGGGVEVQLCSVDASFPWLLFPLALHELGHVLNIRGHIHDDPDAVMSPQSGGDRRFTAADRELFRRANPGFEPDDPCDVVFPVALSDARPVPVRTAHGSLLLWAEADGVQIGAIDMATARVKRAARIATASYPEWVRATLAPEGLWVSWVEGGAMRLAHVSLPGLRASAPLDLDIGTHDFQKVIEVSTAAGDTDLFVAISEGLSNPVLYLYRLDRTSGAQRPLLKTEYLRSSGYFVRLGGALVLAVRNPYGVTLHRWSAADGAPLASKQVVHLSQGDRQIDNFRARVIGDALLLALFFGSTRPVELARVVLDGPGFAVTKTTGISPPGEGNTLLSIDGNDDELVLALSSMREYHPADEVYVMRLDPASLEWRGDWRRLSAPDQVPSVQPWVLAGPTRHVVVWRELHDLMTIEVKTRCF